MPNEIIDDVFYNQIKEILSMARAKVYSVANFAMVVRRGEEKYLCVEGNGGAGYRDFAEVYKESERRGSQAGGERIRLGARGIHCGIAVQCAERAAVASGDVLVGEERERAEKGIQRERGDRLHVLSCEREIRACQQYGRGANDDFLRYQRQAPWFVRRRRRNRLDFREG